MRLLGGFIGLLLPLLIMSTQMPWDLDADVAPRRCLSTVVAPPSGGMLKGSDYWPMIHGLPGIGGLDYKGLSDLNLKNSLSWTWQHPQGRYYTIMTGVLIDDKKDIYLSSMDAMRKFSPTGELLWTYCNPSGDPWTMPAIPTLMDGALYGDTDEGLVFSVNMTTGQEIWRTYLKPLKPLLGDTVFVGSDARATVAHDGVVIIATDRCRLPQCIHFGNAGGHVLRALSAKDGSELWTFEPDAPVWNFYAIFIGDGTFVYQDLEGKLYCNRLSNGGLVWKNGGIPGSFNDGRASLGPNGILLAGITNGQNNNTHDGQNNNTDGYVAAYRHSDGKEMWRMHLIAASIGFSAKGPCSPNKEASVAMTLGAPVFDVYCIDAMTGEVQWQWKGPRYPRFGPAGEQAGLFIRAQVQPRRPQYSPSAWGNAVVDSAGTVYVGFINGWYHAIQDKNRDGHIDSDTEVSKIYAEAAFPDGGNAMAPGILAVATLDRLLVFQESNTSEVVSV